MAELLHLASLMGPTMFNRLNSVNFSRPGFYSTLNHLDFGALKSEEWCVTNITCMLVINCSSTFYWAHDLLNTEL